MSETDTQKLSGSSKLMKYGMVICCSVMLLPVAGFLVAGGTIAGLMTNVGLFAPIALCVGVHVLMFKMMGKSCHSSKSEETPENVRDGELVRTRIPVSGIAR